MINGSRILFHLLLNCMFIFLPVCHGLFVLFFCRIPSVSFYPEFSVTGITSTLFQSVVCLQLYLLCVLMNLSFKFQRAQIYNFLLYVFYFKFIIILYIFPLCFLFAFCLKYSLFYLGHKNTAY